jgi:hypothetical protein
MLSHYLVPDVRPISISLEDAPNGPRIGGNPPEGVLPPQVSSLTQYFATLCLDKSTSKEVSIFLDLDAEEGSPNSIYRNVSRLWSTETFVQIVVHPSSRRAMSPFLASPLSGRALIIEPQRPDIVVEPGGELLLPSKLGGKPYLFYYAKDYIEALNGLCAEGFILFVQMTWPGLAASPVGAWPFDEYTFHLFAKETPHGIFWRYGWG